MLAAWKPFCVRRTRQPASERHLRKRGRLVALPPLCLPDYTLRGLAPAGCWCRILYDLTELENASRFKKGESETRTPKKVANVGKWFGKLELDLSSFLAYFP